jgi:hypothetical protein
VDERTCDATVCPGFLFILIRRADLISLHYTTRFCWFAPFVTQPLAGMSTIE